VRTYLRFTARLSFDLFGGEYSKRAEVVQAKLVINNSSGHVIRMELRSHAAQMRFFECHVVSFVVRCALSPQWARCR
jgi:hypothetical protein